METSLELVSAAHERLKEVMRAVRQLYMRAVNAMLNARRVGVQAAGYQAVTLELRRFSQQIDSSADELQARIRELVYCGAERRRQFRRLRRLEQGADRADSGGREAARKGIEGLQQRLQQQDDDIERLVREVQGIRVRIGRLAETGRNLGLMLRTEAVVNEALADGIGDEVNELMDRVNRDVDAIGGHMERLSEAGE
ncbi:hypothetical protein SAMN05660831_00966 [Thiohalospira halophila DSM 15071]|uniref:Methyl-accepting chemotaxis protein n=1 Tax=Thiohalospira halophila DSM 15071 TaxID=1123397 RepID=A0A1I1Q3A7_9GAMM|nr:hypothetical protein [Thiohalospira halophila]SFD16636.1 hypothetical protein SAMN05660831_00966 [Thiohalospira halophila DSM 15071]